MEDAQDPTNILQKKSLIDEDGVESGSEIQNLFTDSAPKIKDLEAGPLEPAFSMTRPKPCGSDSTQDSSLGLQNLMEALAVGSWVISGLIASSLFFLLIFRKQGPILKNSVHLRTNLQTCPQA